MTDIVIVVYCAEKVGVHGSMTGCLAATHCGIALQRLNGEMNRVGSNSERRCDGSRAIMRMIKRWNGQRGDPMIDPDIRRFSQPSSHLRFSALPVAVPTLFASILLLPFRPCCCTLPELGCAANVAACDQHFPC
jgi:hypothetical protein